MSDKIAQLVESVAGEWSAIVPPNRPAVVLAGQMAATIAGFTAERGRMAFESEPASFDAALAALKEA